MEIKSLIPPDFGGKVGCEQKKAPDTPGAFPDGG